MLQISASPWICAHHQADFLTLIVLHPDCVQGGLENNPWEFCIKDFILKPPIQFFRGLDYITLAARWRKFCA